MSDSIKKQLEYVQQKIDENPRGDVLRVLLELKGELLKELRDEPRKIPRETRVVDDRFRRIGDLLFAVLQHECIDEVEAAAVLHYLLERVCFDNDIEVFPVSKVPMRIQKKARKAHEQEKDHAARKQT